MAGYKAFPLLSIALFSHSAKTALFIPTGTVYCSISCSPTTHKVCYTLIIGCINSLENCTTKHHWWQPIPYSPR
jgi:hypothetical protein